MIKEDTVNIKKSKWSRRLFPTLALVLSVLFLLTLPPISTGATGSANEARQGLQTVTAFAEGSTGEDVPLARAGQWAQASVEINDAPAGAVVSSVQVKYDVVYPEPGDLGCPGDAHAVGPGKR
jgi:hypothetical protein